MFSDVVPLNVSISKRAPAVGFFDEPEEIDMGFNINETAHVDYVFDHYQKVLLECPKALRWFAYRKIKPPTEMIERFRLGFADRSLGQNFTRKMGRKAEVVCGTWQRLGLLKPSGHQFFHGDVVFPFQNSCGQVVGAYGRRISSENRSNQISHYYWMGGKATFFNLGALAENNQIVLCKSPVDALTLLSSGFDNVISTMGLYSFNHHHLAELERYAPSEVVLAFDNSDPANQVSGLISQALEASDIPCLRLPLPRNMDVNDFARRQPDHITGLKELMANAFRYRQTYERLAGFQ
ncbi:MAG: toprim domain-containing protein [Gammaproteobacteria bacterium]|nr:toprim domain-containing protein [Gammaproteobacteria bacterium]